MMSRKHIRELLMVFSRVLMICVLGVNKERLLCSKRDIDMVCPERLKCHIVQVFFLHLIFHSVVICDTSYMSIDRNPARPDIRNVPLPLMRNPKDFLLKFLPELLDAMVVRNDHA
jgi:hypothetical protein